MSSTTETQKRLDRKVGRYALAVGAEPPEPMTAAQFGAYIREADPEMYREVSSR